jgi:hypothetical protein
MINVSTLGSQIRSWALLNFFPKAAHALISRGPQDAFRPVATSATGKLDNSLLNTGSGAGLDADTVDGQHAAAFLPAASYTASDVMSKVQTVDGAASGLDADLLDGNHAAAFAAAAHVHVGMYDTLLSTGAGDLIVDESGGYIAAERFV